MNYINWKNIWVDEIDRYMNNNKYIVLDVRDEYEYDRYHINSAVNVPFNKYFNQDAFTGKAELENILTGKIPILYCERGGSSMMAAKILSSWGIPCINIIGGIVNYKGKFKVFH